MRRVSGTRNSDEAKFGSRVNPLGKESLSIALRVAGNMKPQSLVVVRLVRNCALRRTIQYSRGSSDGADKPRRTGYPHARV